MTTLKQRLIRAAMPLLHPFRTRRGVATLYERMRLARLRVERPSDWLTELGRQRGIRIGRHCTLRSLNVWSEGFLLELGDDVTVAEDVTFVTHDGGVLLLHAHTPDIMGNYGRITIGNNCYIGVGAFVLPNVRIGDNCIVEPGAVVNRSFGNDCVIAGNPATVVGTREEFVARARASARTIVSDVPPDALSPSRRRRLIEAQLDRAEHGRATVEPAHV